MVRVPSLFRPRGGFEVLDTGTSTVLCTVRLLHEERCFWRLFSLDIVLIVAEDMFWFDSVVEKYSCTASTAELHFQILPPFVSASLALSF